MSGYIEAGYVIVLGSLGTYALSIVSRERAARKRLSAASPTAPPPDGRGAPAGGSEDYGEQS